MLENIIKWSSKDAEGVASVGHNLMTKTTTKTLWETSLVA